MAAEARQEQGEGGQWGGGGGGVVAGITAPALMNGQWGATVSDHHSLTEVFWRAADGRDRVADDALFGQAAGRQAVQG